MTNYGEIYDHTFKSHEGYQSWIGSPGVRLAFINHKRLLETGRKHLDYGCGAGFVVELLGSHHFKKASVGADVSEAMCAAANLRLGGDYVKQIETGRAPFEDGSFDLVTCFDVLEHVDAEDVPKLRDDIFRLLRPGGVFFCNISLRLAGSVDINGDNLHRTVKPADWWNDHFAFDEYEVKKADMEMTAWKTMPKQRLS